MIFDDASPVYRTAGCGNKLDDFDAYYTAKSGVLLK